MSAVLLLFPQLTVLFAINEFRSDCSERKCYLVIRNAQKQRSSNVRRTISKRSLSFDNIFKFVMIKFVLCWNYPPTSLGQESLYWAEINLPLAEDKRVCAGLELSSH